MPVTTLKALGFVDIVNMPVDRSASVKMSEADRLELVCLRKRNHLQGLPIASFQAQIADQRTAIKPIEAQSEKQSEHRSADYIVVA